MAMPARTLRGKVVAITGGARGIGRATAAALARRGARVAIGDIDSELAERTANELGGGCIGLPLDVTDRESFAAFLDTAAERLGPLDVLINNAGILHLSPFVDEDDQATRRMIDVNLLGVMNGTRLGVPRLRGRPEGHLVNVASSAGKFPAAGAATYVATKHAVVGLTEAVRLEHRGSPLEFSIVMPGIVKTDMVAGYGKSRGFPEIEPEDVAEEIASALEHPRVNVWVPRSLGRTHRMLFNLPRRVGEAITRMMGSERILLQADRSARAGYESRAAGGDAGRAPSPEGSDPAAPVR